MSSITQLRKQLADLNAGLDEITRQRDAIGKSLGKALSIQFIEANEITRDQVHHVDDFTGWIGDTSEFRGRLVALKPVQRHRWCCWNGAILNTAEFITGAATLHSPGRIEDVPGYFEKI